MKSVQKKKSTKHLIHAAVFEDLTPSTVSPSVNLAKARVFSFGL